MVFKLGKFFHLLIYAVLLTPLQAVWQPSHWRHLVQHPEDNSEEQKIG